MIDGVVGLVACDLCDAKFPKAGDILEPFFQDKMPSGGDWPSS